MYKIRNLFSKTILAAILPMALASGNCWAILSFEFANSLEFTKTDMTTEDLDKGKYEGTAATTAWIQNKEFLTYLLTGEVIYVNDCSHIYGKFAADYGWVVGGKVCQDPLRWNVDGNEMDYAIETGYIMDVNKRFKFIPHIGYELSYYHTKIKRQHLAHSSPTSFIKQNGNKSSSMFYYPYVGIELDFSSRFCNCYDVQFSTTYEIGYVSGHGRNKVRRFFVTDDPNTSRYGSHIKYRDLISHNFEVTASYNLNKKWQISLGLEYQIFYNTHKLPVKLQHNQEIVEAGQFTPSQYHVVSDFTAQQASILISVVYNFGEEGGAYLR